MESCASEENFFALVHIIILFEKKTSLKLFATGEFSIEVQKLIIKYLRLILFLEFFLI